MTISRVQLADALHSIQRKFCAYDHFPQTDVDRPMPTICDCKFGAAKIGQPTEDGNGCPEVRLAHWLVACMTDQEYAALLERHYRDRCGEGASTAPELLVPPAPSTIDGTTAEPPDPSSSGIFT